MRTVRHLALAGLVGLATLGCSGGSTPTKARLGALLFADQNLSSPAGQACADCHDQDRAFSDPESSRTSSMGVVTGRFGVRNAPTAMYAQYVPRLHVDEHGWIGGLFWD